MNKTGLFWLCSAVVLIGIDQCTKYMAYTAAYKQIYPLCGVLSVQYERNVGMSCGIGQEYSPFFIILFTAALTCAIFYLWLSHCHTIHYLSVGLFLIIIGSCSNIIDRLTKGAVIDWITLSAGEYEFPFLFNVADCAIVCGVLCIGYWMYADS
jgi:lipoprotein signal peptidase